MKSTFQYQTFIIFFSICTITSDIMCLKNFPEYFADKVKLAYVHNYFAAVAITSLKQLFRLCLCPEAVSKFR